MIQSFTLLLACQLIGEITVKSAGLPLPGPVLGMLVLVLLLALLPRLEQVVRPTLTGFLGHLSLLFVPAGVGIIGHLGRFGSDGPAMVLALVGSTALTLVVTVFTFIGVSRLVQDRGERASE
ncbi:hypothetical protein BV911_16310 [Pseudoruegeria sp. SK021]|nr:hypothetical protein BV911_16310 [Pseudoruegeria sp. SK021]